MNEMIPPSEQIPTTSEPWVEGAPPVEPSKSRVLSAQRMKYAAEVQLIKNKYGDLEDIRKSLGLSQRKMSQLLFVDPSAWTRWTQGPKNSQNTAQGSAPPHIYRALSWFLLLQEKVPGHSPYQWLQAVARPQLPAHEIASVKNQLETRILEDFEARLAHREKTLRRLLFANGAAAVLALFFLGLALITK